MFWILVAMIGGGQYQDNVSMRFDIESECHAALDEINKEYNTGWFDGSKIRRGKCIKVEVSDAASE